MSAPCGGGIAARQAGIEHQCSSTSQYAGSIRLRGKPGSPPTNNPHHFRDGATIPPNLMWPHGELDPARPLCTSTCPSNPGPASWRRHPTPTPASAPQRAACPVAKSLLRQTSTTRTTYVIPDVRESASSVSALGAVCTSVANPGDRLQPRRTGPDREGGDRTPPVRHCRRIAPDRAHSVNPRSRPSTRIDHNELPSHPKITLLRMPCTRRTCERVSSDLRRSTTWHY